MKRILLLLFLFSSASAMCQSNQAPPVYVKYDAYYHDIQLMLQSWKQEVAHTTLGAIKAWVLKLTDDAPPESGIQLLHGSRKILTDEAIFARRKGGVYIVGKLTSSALNSVVTVDFDLIGTAFAISAEGTCVTNYHVLKDIFHPEDPEAKRIAFILLSRPTTNFICSIKY
jgi:serine protease Do